MGFWALLSKTTPGKLQWLVLLLNLVLNINAKLSETYEMMHAAKNQFMDFSFLFDLSQQQKNARVYFSSCSCLLVIPYLRFKFVYYLNSWLQSIRGARAINAIELNCKQMKCKALRREREREGAGERGR